MEPVRRARAQRPEEAEVDAIQKVDRQDRLERAAWAPAGVPAGLGAKAEVPDKAEVGSLNNSIN
ncbi:MAG: hypothetical protein P8X68_21710 [Desulfobacterales bacterium]|jgi:hypothetical protein